MNGDGPFGVSRPVYDQNTNRPIVPGDTIEEIEDSLSHYYYADLRKLLVIFDCSIGELSRKIAKAKGLKNVDATGIKKPDHDSIKDQGQPSR